MNKLLIISVLIFIVGTRDMQSQSSPSYTAIAGTIQGASGFSGGTINFANTNKTVSSPFLREKNSAAKLYFKLDVGNDYVKNSSGWNFSVLVNLTYQFAGGSAIAKTLTITNTNPELLKTEDVLGYFNSSSPTLTINITSTTINNGATPTPAALTGFIQNYIDNNLRLTVTLAREYDVDVRLLSSGLMSGSPVALPVAISNRLVTFSWQPASVTAYPNYELQILKLYNSDTLFKNDLNQISTAIDWSRALKVETQSHKTGISLTMAEGTGYYIWRVRPIGNYYAGGIANSENYGEWSYAFPDQSVNLLNKNILIIANPLPFAFYFTDPDENINWIYNRVFTEGDNFNKSNPTGIKSSEGMNYADGLLNVRQSQKYNSSENTSIISQTMHDYSGRPALTTMPVPISGGLNGYKLGFVQNSSGTLYTAALFDDDAKLTNPDLIDDATGKPYSYYSNNTTSPVDNTNVPNAEGYAFKRTLFKTDGTNRVEEESGVGKAHSLGTQTSGQGHTTRISYSSPTDDELIHIFGDEAPLAKSVIKTITIDQNNVQSVSYTSKEGKTIATALTSTSTANLSPLTGTSSALTVTNNVSENVSSGGNIVSSKRIAIASNSTTVKMSYGYDNIPGAGTGCPTGNCNFQLRFYLVDLKQNKTYVSDADNLAGITNFTPASSFSFPSGWRFINSDAVSPATITPGGAGNNEVTLNTGEYIFIKELFSGNSSYYADSLVDAVNDKTRPLIDAIATHMQATNSAATYTQFIQFMDSLKIMLLNYNAGTASSQNVLDFMKIDTAGLVPGYTVPLASDFTVSAITSYTADPTLNKLQITTGCCGTLSVSIPKPTVCYPCTGSPSSAYQSTTSISTMTSANIAASPDSLTPYGFNDFKTNSGWSALTTQNKRDAIYKLVDREFIQMLKNKLVEEGFDSSSTSSSDLWKFAPGFNYHSLNFMISNMLISQYYVGTAATHTNGSWYRASASSGGYLLDSLVSALNKPYNYDCQKLAEAWTDAVMIINSFDASGDNNIITGYNTDNEQGNNAAQDNADDDDNWSLDNKFIKNQLAKKIGKEVDDFGTSSDGTITGGKKEALSNLVNVFMDNAGYQFAAVIDGAPLPTFISASNTAFPDDYISYSEAPFGSGFYTSITTGTLSHSNVPFLFSVSSNSPQLTVYTCNTSTFHELYYPYILKPEWMFKYFVYNVFENSLTSSPALNFISDNDVILPHQVSLDIQRNYNQPYSYLPSTISSSVSAAELCSTQPALNYTLSSSSYTMPPPTHINWTTADRVSFYRSISGASKCYSNKGLDVGATLYDAAKTLPQCAPKADLIVQAEDILADYANYASGMQASIKSALEDELTSSCYTIVSCKATNATGIVSEGEIDLMTTAAINSILAQIQIVADKVNGVLLTMPPTNTVACSSPAAITATYTNLMCDLPACSQQDCKEIVTYKDNTIGVTPSRKFSVKYFTDCDQKILDMIRTGTFLPYIPPLDGCTKAAKVWQNVACDSVACGPNYAEKTTCPPSDFKTYSKTYSVTATGN